MSNSTEQFINGATNTIAWDIIIETIKAEKCILFIGPEIFAPSPEVRLADKLIHFLEVDKDEGIRYYDDDLFYFKERQKKTLTYYNIKKFYQQQFEDTIAIFKKIAQIPFHYIISINPDKKLKEVFEKLEFKYNFDFYWKNHPPSSTNPSRPSKENPLIYNLFGSVDQFESLVLTHDDLFDFLASVFQTNNMPNQLKNHIQEADNFIFLGFEFEKWYMQLLLRILHFHNNEDFLKYASNQIVHEDLQIMCYEQFKINFVKDDINSFVTTLHSKCQEANFLRSKERKGESLMETLKGEISSGKIEKVIHKLGDFLMDTGESGEDLRDQHHLFSNRYNRLKKRKLNNVITHEQENIETNKLTMDIIELLNEAKVLE